MHSNSRMCTLPISLLTRKARLGVPTQPQLVCPLLDVLPLCGRLYVVKPATTALVCCWKQTPPWTAHLTSSAKSAF